MRHVLISFCLTLLTALSAHADPGDPWEGTWRNNNSKTIWLFQDGDVVWGSASHSYRYIAQVSPDGRTLRGTYYKNSSNQGLFEWTLEADGQRFTSDYRRKSSNAFPVSIPGSGYGYRRPTDLNRFDYIADGFSDGTQGYDSPINPNDPSDMAWVNFQSPFEQPNAPTIDISDLDIPEPGNAGLWEVRDTAGQQVGTVAMERYVTGFSASGQIRLADFQSGIPLNATFLDAAAPSEDTVTLSVDGDTDRQINIVTIRPDGAAAFNVTYVGDFLGVANFKLRLVLIEGSIPGPPRADISGLTIPEPGTLGLMQVTMNGQRIGTVNWDQPERDVTMSGQIVLPAYHGNIPWDVTFTDRAGIAGDRYSMRHTESGTTFSSPADITEKEGDQYFIRFSPGTFSPLQYREELMIITHIPGSAQRLGPPPIEDDLYTLRIDTARVPAGLAVAVYDAPSRNAAIIGMIANDATGLRLQRCDPPITEDQLRLTGDDLYNVLADMFCYVAAPTVTGWVGGAYLTR